MVSAHDALRAYTYGSAYASYEEDRKGWIGPGRSPTSRSCPTTPRALSRMRWRTSRCSRRWSAARPCGTPGWGLGSGMTERALVAFSGLDAAHQVAVRHVYESSFPLALRAPWEEITARPSRRAVARAPGRGEAGWILALIRHLGDTSMSFIRYFVVDAQRAVAGTDRRCCRPWSPICAMPGRSMLLLDVEDPDGRPDESRNVATTCAASSSTGDTARICSRSVTIPARPWAGG